MAAKAAASRAGGGGGGKAISATIRLLIGAGEAKPAPPVGPALGQAGINIMSFCKDFNAATAAIKVRERKGRGDGPKWPKTKLAENLACTSIVQKTHSPPTHSFHRMVSPSLS
jgi:hypothetical protein